MHTANIERSENYSSSGCLPEVKNNKKSLNFQAYKRWSFTRGCKCKKCKSVGVLDSYRWSLMGVGGTWRFDGNNIIVIIIIIIIIIIMIMIIVICEVCQ